MGWNAIFVLGFMAVLVFILFGLKKKGVDTKIKDKWDKAKDEFKEKVDEVKDKF